jgi:hypothetical protein
MLARKQAAPTAAPLGSVIWKQEKPEGQSAAAMHAVAHAPCPLGSATQKFPLPHCALVVHGPHNMLPLEVPPSVTGPAEQDAMFDGKQLPPSTMPLELPTW